jgi:serine/threonine protein kinase
MCLSFEMLGPSLLDLIIDYGYSGIPVDLVKRIALHALRGLDFLHTQCGIIHTDVKPENVLLTLPEVGLCAQPQTGIPSWWAKHSVHNQNGARKLRPGWTCGLDAGQIGAKIVDLGNSCLDSHHYTEKIQTIEYRSPEVVIGSRYSTPADIWSLACTIFELVTGEYLFDPQEGTNKHGQVCYSREEDLIAHHQELVGSFDPAFALSGKNSATLFHPDGSMRRINGLKFWSLLDVLKEKYGWKHEAATELVSFLEPMLQPDPTKRATAAELLKHPWLAGLE